MKRSIVFFTFLFSFFISAWSQAVGEAFYIYRNDGEFNAFFRSEVEKMEYSCYDLDGVLHDDYVTQEVYTADSLYRIPIAAIDSVAFEVNAIHVSSAYVPVDEDGYTVEEADTLNGVYQLLFHGNKPSLKVGDVIAIVNDTLSAPVKISSIQSLDSNRVRITSEASSYGDIFTDGTFTLSTDNPLGEAKPRGANVYYPVEYIYFDESNKPRHIRRRTDTDIYHSVFSNSIDYSGYELKSTRHSKLYLETCKFDFNLGLEVTCNFSSKDEAIQRYRHGELALNKTVVKGSVNSDIMIRFDVTGKSSEDGDPVMLKRNLHKPIYAKFLVSAVPIIVEVTTHLLMDGSYETEGSFSAHTGYATNSTAELGFSWTQSSGFNPYSSFNSSYEWHRPTIEGKAHLACKLSVFPRITFSLYGIVGPSFDIKPYLRESLDLGFYDELGDNNVDYYGAEFNTYVGIDAAVGLTYLAESGRKPFYKTRPWNVVEQQVLESPKEIRFEKAEPEKWSAGKPMSVSFKVSEYYHLKNESQKASLPYPVKFATNSGTLSSTFALVDTSTGLVTIEWTPAAETDDNGQPYLMALMHDANGKLKTADIWKPEKAKDGPCPDDNHPHMIDLGIGVKWACCNVGASSPEQYGGYYAWGETEEKSYYHRTTYKYWHDKDGDNYWDADANESDNIGSNISGTGYDVARAKWGAPYRMPTLDEIKKLVNNCSYEWTTLNGVKGGKFTGPNGNWIFLPAAGYRWDDELGNEGSCGYYWSGSLFVSNSPHAYCLYFYSGFRHWDYNSRSYGRSVRPVTE